MNKELEKAIKSMRRFVKCKQDTTAVSSKEMQTVLNYIDNSISKEAVKKKIEELKKEMKEIQEENNMATYCFLADKLEALQELLEEK